jgi:hypothetical protein
MRVLNQIRRALAEYGLAGILVRQLAGFIDRSTRGRVRLIWYVLVAQPVRTDWRIPSKLGHSVTVRVVRAGDALLAQCPRPPSVIASRFEQGAMCIAAERDGNLAGYLWLCADRYREDEVRCTFLLPDPAARWWDFDVWVRPDQRSGVVFALLWREAHAMLHALGAQWSCSRIARLNPGSLAAHRRLGATVVGQAIFLRGVKHQLMIASPARMHFSGSARRVPNMTVAPPLRRTPTAANLRL